MSYRVKLNEESYRGLKAELYAICTVRSQLIQGDEPTFRKVYSDTGTRQIKFTLVNDSVTLEPGILSYAHGDLTFQVVQEIQGGFLKRAVRSAGSGESAFGTLVSGTGEVWTEPTTQHFIFATMEGNDIMLLDDKAYYAAQGSLKRTNHTHKKVQGAVSGNGLMQPRLDGAGLFVVECPVSVDEVEVLELGDGQTATIDGDMMLMFTGTMDVTLGPLVRGLRNAARSGEGLVYTLRGPGQVFLTPTHISAGSFA